MSATPEVGRLVYGDDCLSFSYLSETATDCLVSLWVGLETAECKNNLVFPLL